MIESCLKMLKIMFKNFQKEEDRKAWNLFFTHSIRKDFSHFDPAPHRKLNCQLKAWCVKVLTLQW